MNSLKIRDAFWFWSLVCLSPFLVLNLAFVLLTLGSDFHGIWESGFPLRWFALDRYHGTGVHVDGTALRTNMLVAIGASLIGGKLLQSHFSSSE